MRVWHRDLYDAEIVACPDTEVIGKSFGEVGERRGIEPADALLDLVIEHGSKLRWRTTIANDRDDVLDRLQRSADVQVGFADSGAHLRNMAFYNCELRYLERVHQRGFMPIEAAVHRVTGELADWYGLDAGRLAPGHRADIAVIDPAGFDGSSGEYAEAPMPGTERVPDGQPQRPGRRRDHGRRPGGLRIRHLRRRLRHDDARGHVPGSLRVPIRKQHRRRGPG